MKIETIIIITALLGLTACGGNAEVHGDGDAIGGTVIVKPETDIVACTSVGTGDVKDCDKNKK